MLITSSLQCRSSCFTIRIASTLHCVLQRLLIVKSVLRCIVCSVAVLFCLSLFSAFSCLLIFASVSLIDGCTLYHRPSCMFSSVGSLPSLSASFPHCIVLLACLPEIDFFRIHRYLMAHIGHTRDAFGSCNFTRSSWSLCDFLAITVSSRRTCSFVFSQVGSSLLGDQPNVRLQTAKLRYSIVIHRFTESVLYITLPHHDTSLYRINFVHRFTHRDTSLYRISIVHRFTAS